MRTLSKLALLMSAATLYQPTGFAQDNTTDANETSKSRFGTIVVTAQRREQDLQDVPVAISAFDADALKIVQVNDAVDLVDTIPNMIGGNNTTLGTANMYYLRGQGQDESFATFDPAVGTYVDDVFVARQNSNNFNLFDVERLEVLRGPQGTLFGKNTSGGAVNIVMKEPSDDLGGYLESSYGSFNRFLVRGSVDLPISENVRTKLSAFSVTDEGWLKNSVLDREFNNKNAQGFRAAVDIDLNDDLNWSLTGDYVKDSQANVTGTLIGDEVVSTSILSGGLEAVFPGAGTNQKAKYPNRAESVNFVSNLEWSTDSGSLNFIVGKRSLEQDFLANFPLPAFAAFFPSSPEDIFLIDNAGEHDQLSAELKWTGDYLDDRLKLVTGLYFLNEDNTTDVASYFAFSTPSRDRIIENSGTNQAVYAQGDFKITDKLTATVGVRYTQEEKEFSVVDNIPLPNGAGGTLASGGNQSDLTNANLEEAGISREIDENVLTPRFALQYDFTDDVMAFVSATRGFRTGGWNARSDTPAALTPFNSEFVWSYELGTRANIGEVLTVNATAFFMEVDDLQITTAISTSAGTAFSIGNAGQMENKGLELELFLRPTDNLNLFAFAGFQDAKYLPSSLETLACTIPNGSFAAFDVNCNPAIVKRAPDWTFNIGGAYDFNLPNGGVIQPRASLRSVADSYTATINRGLAEQYSLYNLGVEYTPASKAWSASLECTNCANERYVTASFGAGDFYYNAPGRWEAKLIYRFGGEK